MSAEQLEQRLAAVEAEVAAIRRELGGKAPAPEKWWDPKLPPMTEHQLEVFDEMVAYGQYFRQTGQDPPPDWKPGDPIPEPEWWGPETPDGAAP